MERTITIFYKGARAHYNVAKQADGTFKARLLQYNGSNDNRPPQALDLRKQGSHWNERENTYDNLVEELGASIQMNEDFYDRGIYISQDRE